MPKNVSWPPKATVVDLLGYFTQLSKFTSISMTPNLVDRPIAQLLVVDDDVLQGTIISRVGTQCGYVVQSVSTLDAALTLLESQTFDCVTVDLVLEERDGIELLRFISELATCPQVVVISGCDERILAATLRMAQDLGMRDAICLSKPLDFGVLRKALALRSPTRKGYSPDSQRLVNSDAALLRQSSAKAISRCREVC